MYFFFFYIINGDTTKFKLVFTNLRVEHAVRILYENSNIPIFPHDTPQEQHPGRGTREIFSRHKSRTHGYHMGEHRSALD